MEEETNEAYMTIMTTCSASTVSPWREMARTLRARSVENVQRAKKAAHTTNTKKNFWFCAPTHCPIPTSPYGQLPCTTSEGHQKTYKGNDDRISTHTTVPAASLVSPFYPQLKMNKTDAPYHTSCNDVFVAAW